MLGILSIIGIALWMTWLAKNIYPILFYLLQVAPKREALESPSKKKRAAADWERMDWIGNEPTTFPFNSHVTRRRRLVGSMMSKDNNYPSWFLFIAPFPRWKKNKHFDVYVKHKCRCCGHSHREQHQDGRHQARRIVLLGKPCSGKGTQAPLLRYDIYVLVSIYPCADR